MSGAKLKFDIWMSWKAWPGEASPLSLVNTQARHKSTTITGVPANETVLVNALVKFRAGSHTDATGVSTDVGCPFHVPWVWCETLLTFTKGNLKLYGRGSIFPTHIWYLDDAQKLKQPQVGDTSFPLTYTKKVSLWPLAPTSIAVPTMPTIVVRNLQIYPVLSAGAPAVPDSAQMPPLSDEAKQSGPVDTHAYTVSGDSILTSP